MTPNEKRIIAVLGAAFLLLAAWMWHKSDIEAAADRARLNATLKQQGDLIADLKNQIADRDKKAAADKADLDKKLTAAKTPDQQGALLTAIMGAMGNKPPITITVPKADALPDAPVATLNKQQLTDFTQFGVSCRKCEIDRDTALQDGAAKDKQIAAVTAERDAAIKFAHGGSVFQRVKRAAKWFGIGAGVGAAAITILKH